MDEQMNTGPKLDVSVKVYPTRESGSLLAFASVNLGGCFAVNGIRIMDTKKGTFIAMPGRKDQEGKYHDICCPIRKSSPIPWIPSMEPVSGRLAGAVPALPAA